MSLSWILCNFITLPFILSILWLIEIREVWMEHCVYYVTNFLNQITIFIDFNWFLFCYIDKKLNHKLKLEALQSCIFPTLIYGCQTWKLTVNEKKQIQICQRKMERKILGLSLRDKISNTRLRQMTNTRDMAHQGEATWRDSKVADGRWFPPRGIHASGGRPGTRWADSFKSIAGPMWSRIAKDREKWRTLQNTSAEWES